jgi:hypothetical protein
MLNQAHAVSPWLSYGLCTAIVLVAAEFGRLIGNFSRRRHPEPIAPHLLTLEGAALGLVALMIGFTFSMALSRFDARLSAVVNEANAISTTALRARMLPEPQASDVKTLLQQYTQLRLDQGTAPQDSDELEQAVQRSNDLQAKLWQIAMAVSAGDPHSVPAGLLVQTLNQMIDLQETRLAARGNRVPGVVFALLYGIAGVAIGFSGFVSSLGGSRGRIPVAVMAVLIGSVIGMIADIDRAQSGFITVSQQAMHDVKTTLGE